MLRKLKQRKYFDSFKQYFGWPDQLSSGLKVLPRFLLKELTENVMKQIVLEGETKMTYNIKTKTIMMGIKITISRQFRPYVLGIN